jgi:hygromycin-B 7''-O-kinase
VGRADVYRQPEAPDPVLPSGVVLELARRHVSADGVTGIDESGGEARVYLVDHDVLVKTQRPHRVRPRTSLAKEAYLLDALAGTLHPYLPRLLGYGRTDTAHGEVEYLCLSRVPGAPAGGQAPGGKAPGGKALGGKALGGKALGGEARARFMTELAVLLRRLHSAAVDDDRVPRDPGWAALRRRLEFEFEDVADAMPRRPPAWPLPLTMRELRRRVLPTLPSTGPYQPVLLHANPGPPHVFVDDERLSALIDFGDSYVGHPALDLHRWPDPADRMTLRDQYRGDAPAGDSFDRVWSVAMILADVKEISRGSALARVAAADLVRRVDEL